MRYYTEKNVEITDRIADGKTELFLGASAIVREQTKARAAEWKSYYYEVFADKNDKRIHVGYAVPK